MKEKLHKIIFGLILCLICQAGLTQVPGFTFGFHAQTLSDSEILLKWSDNDNETYYSIERSLTPETGFVEIATLEADQISYIDAGLPAGSKYYYRMIAGNEEGRTYATEGGIMYDFYSRVWLASTFGFADALEYFIDTDPGHGLGTSVPITSAYEISDINFSVDISSISAGFHTLYLRAKDEADQWSITHNRTFFKLTVPEAGNADIVEVEYFIDTDPGFGSGTSVPVTPSSTISDLTFAVDLTSVSSGFHTLYVRAKDSQGAWSLTNISQFYTDGLPAELSDIVRVEYFIDTDPGFGLGTPLSITNGEDVTADFSIDLTGTPDGVHTLYVRAEDSNGNWSITNMSNFILCQPQDGPVVEDTVYYCAGDQSSPLTATGTDLKWYNSQTSITPLPSAPTPSTEASGLTSYFVTQTIDACESQKEEITVKVKNIPEKPSISSGYDQNSESYTLTSSSLINNQWIYEGNDISGAESAEYITDQFGNYQVRVTIDGCSNTSDMYMVDIVSASTSPTITFFKVVPNPASDRVRISVQNSGIQENIKLVLQNVQGVPIAEKSISNGGSWEIDASNYPSGIYFIQMIAGGSMKTEKIFFE